MANIDEFAANHGELSDSALLEPPRAVLHPLDFFLCTYKAEMDSPAARPPGETKARAFPHTFIPFERMTAILAKGVSGNIVAFQSNTGYGSQPGYERLVAEANARFYEQRSAAAPGDEALAAAAAEARRAAPPKKKKRALNPNVPSRISPRKLVGLGVCFNSAIQLKATLPDTHAGAAARRIYEVKYFPTTGQTQVSGGVFHDLSDVACIIDIFVKFINETLRKEVLRKEVLGLPEGPLLVVKEGSTFPNMMNFRTRIFRSSPRIGLKHVNVVRYFHVLETHPAIVEHFERLAQFEAGGRQGAPPRAPDDFEDPAGLIVVPPWRVTTTKLKSGDNKISVNFNDIVSPRGSVRKPLVNIFSKVGKINLLGLDTTESALAIYDFLGKVLRLNWSKLVRIIPRPD